MGLDIIARAAANAAASNAAAAQASALVAQSSASTAANSAALAMATAMPADLFSSLPGKTIDRSITMIVSSGFSAPGKGIGHYISDSLATAALAAAHPRFCKQTANGRYFRLVPASPDKSISVAQGGASGGAGINEQPIIQATIDYACATGCKWVEFPETTYELWCPTRTSHPSSAARDGHPIVITSTDGLGLRGCRAGTNLLLKNSQGGSKNTITQVVNGINWQGGGIFILPNGVWPSAGASVDWIAIENLSVDGGVTFNPADRSNVVLNDKGLRVQDVICNRLHLRNCTFRNFAGEIYYVGGSTIAMQMLENVTLDGSPQSALNPSSSGRFLGINVQAGNSYQACEVLGAQNFTMIGGRLYDCYSSSLGGGPDGSIPQGYPFTYSTRVNNRRPPWVQLIGTRIEGFTDSIYLGSWIHGSIVTVDCTVTLNPGVGALKDIHLNIEAWADQRSAFPAVQINGPPTLTTQINGGPAGAYVVPPSNIRVNVQARRTQLAQANNRYISAGVHCMPGLYDKNTVAFTVSGETNLAFSVSPNPPAGFALPRIDIGTYRSTGQPYGGAYDYPAADKVYDVSWAAMVLFPAAGTWNITLNSTYGYADGQKVLFYHGDPAPGKVVNFPAAGAGLKLQRDRKLYAAGDFLELRYDAVLSRWVEERYVTATRQVFSGSATYDAPELAAGATASTTVTVTGAALGDAVTAVTLDTNAGGLIVTGYVSAANTVTVVLYNPTAAAVNLPSANLSVQVQKR
ncbi:hypothetical protein [Novosphingobium sp. TH158]|uniref:hypothetical protein n=1 Tax=Novosphingobium sp. TH158 TaxID=2067455 RepID=UPI000C7D81C2|nr:hypothetical protein [Novosphingobium sp. TH158]PLK27034.1 hypothetical protein C0V78_09170 [Novosphingobium sp. TH158]